MKGDGVESIGLFVGAFIAALTGVVDGADDVGLSVVSIIIVTGVGVGESVVVGSSVG